MDNLETLLIERERNMLRAIDLLHKRLELQNEKMDLINEICKKQEEEIGVLTEMVTMIGDKVYGVKTE